MQKDELSLPDRSIKFMHDAAQLLSYLAKREITIQTPFEYQDKTDMVKLYKDMRAPIDELLKTIGCYNDSPGHCGNCAACFRRYIALANNDIDPGYELTSSIKQYYSERLDQYSTDRQERMKRWL